jgi:hypothetical protein
VASRRAHRPDLLHWKHNHWHGALSSVELSLLGTIVGRSRPCWPPPPVGQPAWDHSRAEEPPPPGLLAVAGEDGVGEAGEVVEVPPAADGAVVVEEEEGAQTAADGGGAATPRVVWPQMSPGPARSPNFCLFWRGRQRSDWWSS